MLVEMKSGETFNGCLDNVDSWMNLKLTDVIRTSPSGDKFWRIQECYIKGSSIKYVRMGEEVMEAAKEENRRNTRPRVFRDNSGRRGGRRGSTPSSPHQRSSMNERPQSGTKFAPGKSSAAIKFIKK